MHVTTRGSNLDCDKAQGPHSQILMTGRGGGGVRQRFIFYNQKNHNFRICQPKKITAFLACGNNSLSPFFATPKNPSGFFFFATQKNPGVFHRTNFWPKFQTQKKSLGPPPPPSLKYVSGVPGVTGSCLVQFFLCIKSVRKLKSVTETQ